MQQCNSETTTDFIVLVALVTYPRYVTLFWVPSLVREWILTMTILWESDFPLRLGPIFLLAYLRLSLVIKYVRVGRIVGKAVSPSSWQFDKMSSIFLLVSL